MAKRFALPPTLLNHIVLPGRRFATSTVALAGAKRYEQAFRCHLERPCAHICAGALRELLLHLSHTPDRPLIGSMPVSTDPSPERVSGNALGGLLFSRRHTSTIPFGGLSGLASQQRTPKRPMYGWVLMS